MYICRFNHFQMYKCSFLCFSVIKSSKPFTELCFTLLGEFLPLLSKIIGVFIYTFVNLSEMCYTILLPFGFSTDKFCGCGVFTNDVNKYYME